MYYILNQGQYFLKNQFLLSFQPRRNKHKKKILILKNNKKKIKKMMKNIKWWKKF